MQKVFQRKQVNGDFSTAAVFCGLLEIQKKHDEFELKCQFQHVSLRKKHQEKTGRLCDSHNTNWDLWFGISKKTPPQKSLVIQLDPAMVFTQTDPANTASMRPLHSLFKQRTLQGIVFQFSTSQINKRGKYTTKITHSHCASAVGWTSWMCGCFWLI